MLQLIDSQISNNCNGSIIHGHATWPTSISGLYGQVTLATHAAQHCHPKPEAGISSHTARSWKPHNELLKHCQQLGQAYAEVLESYHLRTHLDVVVLEPLANAHGGCRPALCSLLFFTCKLCCHVGQAHDKVYQSYHLRAHLDVVVLKPLADADGGCGPALLAGLYLQALLPAAARARPSFHLELPWCQPPRLDLLIADRLCEGAFPALQFPSCEAATD